jgi:hypothetical protein
MNEMLLFGIESAVLHAPGVLGGMFAVWILLALVADLPALWRRAALVCAGTAGGLRAYNAVEMLGPHASLAQAAAVVAAMLLTALLFHGGGRLLAEAVNWRRTERPAP